MPKSVTVLVVFCEAVSYLYLGHFQKVARLAFLTFTVHRACALHSEIPGISFLLCLYIGWFTGLWIFTLILAFHCRAHLFAELRY
jgi:hypothetical protein